MLEEALKNAQLREKVGRIRLLLLDVDGVLTDGKLYFDNQGNEFKAFNTLDGHGIKMLRKSGVEVGIITGRTSKLVEKRAADLGVTLLVQGREDKFTALEELRQTFPCALDEIAFLGDDWPDLSAMTRVGLSLAVKNAHWQVIEHAHWVTSKNGGAGAVREICDLLMLGQNTYRDALSHYVSY